MPGLKLLIPESPMQLLPSLACAIGLEDAIVLQQFHYWLLRAEKDDGGTPWCAAPLSWLREKFPFLSVATIRRVMGRLEGRGILKSRKPRQTQRDQTKEYTVVYEAIPEQVQLLNMSTSHVLNLSSCNGPNRAVVLRSIQEEDREEETTDPPSGGETDRPLRIVIPVRRKPHPIPIPFELTDERRAYAATKGCRDPAAGHEVFVDHWVGNGALKASWDATERNWVRRAHSGDPRWRCICYGGAQDGPDPEAVQRGVDRLQADREAYRRGQRA